MQVALMATAARATGVCGGPLTKYNQHQLSDYSAEGNRILKCDWLIYGNKGIRVDIYRLKISRVWWGIRVAYG